MDLSDIYAGRLSGLKDELIWCFRLGVHMARGGIRKTNFMMSL